MYIVALIAWLLLAYLLIGAVYAYTHGGVVEELTEEIRKVYPGLAGSAEMFGSLRTFVFAAVALDWLHLAACEAFDVLWDFYDWILDWWYDDRDS